MQRINRENHLYQMVVAAEETVQCLPIKLEITLILTIQSFKQVKFNNRT